VRVVIDDEYLDAKIAPLPLNGLQGLAEHFAGVERDDDQGDIEGVRG